MTITQILLRRGTTTEWVANNIVLEFGEPAVERKADGSIIMKIGDGIRPWSELPEMGGGSGYELIDPSRFRIEELIETDRIDLKEGLRVRTSSLWASTGSWSSWASMRTRLPENVFRAATDIKLNVNSSSSGLSGNPYGKLDGNTIEDRGLTTNHLGQQTRVFKFDIAIQDSHLGSGFSSGFTWTVEVSLVGYPSGDWANEDNSNTFIRIRPNHTSQWYSDYTFIFLGDTVLDGFIRKTGQRLIPLGGLTLNGLYRIRLEKEIAIIEENNSSSGGFDASYVKCIRAEGLVSNQVPSAGSLVTADYWDSWSNQTSPQPVAVMDLEIKDNAILIRSQDFLTSSCCDDIMLLANKWQVEKVGG